MTVSDQQAGTWRSAAALGFSKYEVSCDGFGRDQRPVRRIDNRKPLAVSLSSSGRPQVKPYNDDGRQCTVDVHVLVLRTYAGDRPPGMVARHLDDDPFNNRWRPGDEAQARAADGNLVWGPPWKNVEDGFQNGGRHRAAPRPVRHCVRCQAVLSTNGKRCHPCVVELGQLAAPLLGRYLRRGRAPEEVAVQVAAELDYPSAEGIVKLAVVHGGYGQPRRGRWLQRVTATVRDIFHRTDGSHGK